MMDKVQKPIDTNFQLPKILHRYHTKGFDIQQKARFMLYLLIAISFVIILLICSTSLVQIASPEYNGIYWPIIIPQIIVFFMFLVGLVLLIKGYFELSANLLLILTFGCLWTVMWIDRGQMVVKLDTIALVIAMLSSISFFVTRNHKVIILYILGNVFLLLLFVFFQSRKLVIPTNALIDYVIDSGVAIIFTGLIAFQLYRINKKTLNKALLEIAERKKVEQDLEEYQSRLEYMVQERTEELAAANEELVATNDELQNQKEELQIALNVLSTTQNQLIQSEKMASLGVLSAGIAHEINNPLNYIQGGTFRIQCFIEDHLKEYQEQFQPFFEDIETGIIRASEIVASLNHYSRQNEMEVVGCDIHAIIDHCLIILNNQLKDKVEIKKTYTRQAYSLKGNEGKLHQVFLNLIANAEHSIEKKGLIEINTEVNGNWFLISISDNGMGINSDNLQKIFDPFFTTKAPGKGTGLGLSITYKIIQEHNGQINIESDFGMGTRVMVKLPLAD